MGQKRQTEQGISGRSSAAHCLSGTPYNKGRMPGGLSTIVQGMRDEFHSAAISGMAEFPSSPAFRDLCERIG